MHQTAGTTTVLLKKSRNGSTVEIEKKVDDKKGREDDNYLACGCGDVDMTGNGETVLVVHGSEINEPLSSSGGLSGSVVLQDGDGFDEVA
ncbi:hypothetical protein, partial [Actinocorallia libanotica]|uniref:hypothetical protein n=1 Tax=Actinocorallia libanotica TaxID=46162 RepID=UPI0031DC1481